ncbi:CubicO group peptidase (beta-lactamase class C family) [Rhizomicrobium palustre]|uniref:CubicO group peptidase (Beta-lactamase class C family) n=1 Tax=Rhizomicrobium palustre TaxID=189966 RepID=A0A846N3U8_9PROT|nr:serine hydrolase domain-containing protein [Rhizomicrobium palustre]NIK89911.1 CubicO group peptidase (beta-lactamase class C family) [Rhizomicrobium palustre]
MHRRALIQAGVTTAAMALAPAVLAKPVADSGRIDDYRKLIGDGMARHRLTGASAILVQENAVVWAEGFGHADRENGIAMRPDTIVPIGSVTKTFTALALMQLRAEGRVDIDRPVRDFVPNLRIGTRGADFNRVTVRSVMTHTSGLPSDVFKNTGLESADYTNVVDLLNDTELAAWPQTIGLYSNIGYSLLGNVIRNVSGQAYPDYVRSRILRPMGMARSGFATEAGLPARARLYYQDGRPTPPLELRDQPAGGLYSSVEDLARYAIGLMKAWGGAPSPLIDPASVQAMFRLSNAHIAIETNKKGLGWFMFQRGGAFAMYHAGSTGFANAALLLLPQKRIAAAILVNSVGGDALASAFAFRVLEDYGLKTEDIRPSPHLPPVDPNATPVTLATEALAAHVGDYPRKRTFATITLDGDGLTLDEPDGRIRLRPLSDGSFQPLRKADGGQPQVVVGERYRFAEVGPYHVLFSQSDDDGEHQAGYRVVTAPLAESWRARAGRYDHFGYQIPGAEQILAAEINILQERLMQLQLVYNSGAFTYPMVVAGPRHAFTGGLGPETTGELVRFSEDGVLTYSGLTFRRSAG